jgi:hypothetical protein
MQSTFGGYEVKAGYLPALSIQQPYAWRIINGLQTIEHRNWATSYRGQLLIHAPQKIDVAAIEKLPDVPQMPSAYEVGGIVGIATLSGIAKDGQYGFLLRDAKPLPFVAYKGALGLFGVPESVLQPEPDERGIDLLQFVAGREKPEEGTVVICARKGVPSGRPAMKWEKGDLCWVELDGKQYPGKVLDWAFSSEGDYLQITLEYDVTYKDWSGQTRTRTVLWPKPIQSYKLRRRVS